MGFARSGDTIVCDNAGDAKAERGARQTVRLYQKTPKPLLASVWSRAENVGGFCDPGYSLYLDVAYADGSRQWGRTSCFSTGAHAWQERRILLTPRKPIRSITVHLLLRRHSGKAWFRSPRLERVSFSKHFVVFDGAPIAAMEIPESGFELRDVAADSDYVRPTNGRALGIHIETRRSRGPAGSEFIDVNVRDELGKDRAVCLVYARRLAPKSAVRILLPWRSPLAQRGREYMWTSRFESVGSRRLSRYPFAAVASRGKGYGIGIDAAAPAFFRVGYNHSVRQLFLAWDLGFAPEHPAAHLRFCTFTFDPSWGFRAALEKWYRIFPDYFRCRTPKQGVWMPFAKISEVQGWRDFGFKFKENINETAWDDAHDILTFRHTGPMTWWMPMPKWCPRTMEYALAVVRHHERSKNWRKRRQARALYASGMRDERGRYAHIFKNEAWCRGVVWSMNSMPGIPGDATDFKLKWNSDVKKRLYGRKSKGDLDGEYLDCSEGHPVAELDYDRRHFAAAQTPLTFSAGEHRPAIFSGLIAFEYARAIARDVHDMNKFMMANETPNRLCWLAPLMDVMGTETNWRPNGRWKPMSMPELFYRRALCGPKPYCFLMNTDFNHFSHELVERYMMRATAFGMFPGFFSANGATGQYFTRPELYNRDRDLFRKYVPVCKRVAEAGWRPVTNAWAEPAPAVHVERFGDSLLTVFNASRRSVTARVLLPAKASPSARELLSGKAVVWSPGHHAPDGTLCAACRLVLGPEQLAVLEIRR